MSKNKIILTSLAATLFLSGCSAMMPYRDDFQCERGKNSGVCASVSETYEMSFDMDTLRKRKLGDVPCEDGNCNQDIKLNKKDITGEPLNSADEYAQKSKDNENQRLKEIVEAVEIKRLQDSRPIIIQNFNKVEEDKSTKITTTTQPAIITEQVVSKNIDCSKVSSDDAIHNINESVKVCVFNANIRKEPSCTASVVRVVKKGDVLYAEYERNGWVKTNDGYIHKSIITQK